MKRTGYPPGSWVHVFTLRERVISAVEVLEEPRNAAYIANLADGTPEETERVLDGLVEEGIARVVDGEYDADRSDGAVPTGVSEGLDPSELDADTLRRVESAVRELGDAAADIPDSEMSEYRTGRIEGYASVLAMLSELLAEAEERGEEPLEPN